MLGDLVQRAFAAGEISPNLYGRTELQQYDFALAQACNWFVDYRGGLSTRPGSRFVDLVMHDDLPTKFLPFEFGSADFSSYVILFGHQYIRFIQNGSYILEASKAIGGYTNANPGVFTVVAHGYVVGDWVKLFDMVAVGVGLSSLTERTFEINTTPTGNTFTLKDPLTGLVVDTTPVIVGVFVSGNVQRIYTLVTGYNANDLDMLRAEQNRSVITLTHQLYPQCELTRVSASVWTFAAAAFGATIAKPTGVTLTHSAAGVAGVAFTVTAVSTEGEESLPAQYAFDPLCVDYASVAGSMKVTWTGVADALYYRIYRSQIIPIGADISRGMQMGLVGIAYGTSFTDRNFIPNFTETPPTRLNPFVNNGITYVQVTAPGAGYTRASVVSASGGGTGFEAYPIVDAGGGILGIVVVNPGQNYVAPVIAVTVGAGATFAPTSSPASGNYPGVSETFQQRKNYAGSLNEPLTVEGSRPGKPKNFDVSLITQADDAYSFEIDSKKVAPIRHLRATRSGMLIFTEAGLWQLAGGNGIAVSPTNAIADPQNANGISTLVPLSVETDLLYQEAKGGAVRLMTYNDTEKVFKAGEVSLFSAHLLEAENPIVAWDYAQDPGRVVHAVLADGKMLNFTIVKDQELFGWTRQETKGLYTDVITIQEELIDVTYTMVQRRVASGAFKKFIEMEVRRDFVVVEDAWCVDAGLSLPANYPAADIQIEAGNVGDIVTVTASAVIPFQAQDVGVVLRANGGKLIVTSFTDTTHVEAQIVRAMTVVLPQDEDNTPLPVAAGSWSYDVPVSTIGNLWHLEGETVSILGDGNVLTRQVVANGKAALDSPCTRVIAGLKYQPLAQTLPVKSDRQVLDGKVTRIVKIAPRLLNSRGLTAGQATDLLEQFRERGYEPLGEPTVLQSGVKEMTIEGVYEMNASLYFIQDDPLPATLLGFVQQVDVGDDVA